MIRWLSRKWARVVHEWKLFREEQRPIVVAPLPKVEGFNDELATRLPPLLSELAQDPTVTWPAQYPPAALAAALETPPSAIHVLRDDFAPERDDELPQLVRLLPHWREHLADHEAICWIQPRSAKCVVTTEEAEQLVGLVAGVDLLDEGTLPDGTSYVLAGGRLRRDSIGFVVHWDRASIERTRSRRASLRAVGASGRVMREGIHLLELPAGSQVTERWAQGVARWFGSRVWTDADNAFGVYTQEAAGDVDRAMQIVKQAASKVGVRDRLRCHRVINAATIASANLALERCRRFGLTVDFSPARWSPGTASDAYVEGRGYAPLECDARAPASIANRESVIVIPTADPSALDDPRRTWWERMMRTNERTFEATVRPLTDAPSRAIERRLLPALDREQRAAYLDDLRVHQSRVAEWHHFHVYNWAPPPAYLTVAFAFEVGALREHGSRARQLAHVMPDAPFATSRRLLDEARAAAVAGGASSLAEQRRRQISAHGYLSTERSSMTADSEQLVVRMPARLGRTLEIGFGYGLMAERVAERASLYVGVDLQVAQAVALGDRGGRGLVGEIHALPFADGTFDSVIADNVLEHASYPLTALREIRRILSPTGVVYALIPLDQRSHDYQIRTHLWKVDEAALHEAARQIGMVAETQVLDLGSLGVFGCFPASAGTTCLLVLSHQPPARQQAVS